MKLPSLDGTALGRIYLLLLGVAFAGLTALGIHGSSVSMWSIVFQEEKTTEALLYSQPRKLRSDEWLVCTPSILAQARHQPPFPIENPILGAGRSPMLMNLPTKHYSTIFRPQLWGYFLFDVEHGFAWNWNAKIFGLTAAMFLLIRRLTGGSFWLAFFGSIWVYASSYTQWWFSCPPMLPEMLASWALAIWCTIRLFDGVPRPCWGGGFGSDGPKVRPRWLGVRQHSGWPAQRWPQPASSFRSSMNCCPPSISCRAPAILVRAARPAERLASRNCSRGLPSR
jgi:hypothetical protein